MLIEKFPMYEAQMKISSDEISDTKKLGELIRERRREMKITQMEAAKFCNLSHTGIGKIENGVSDVKFSTLMKLFKILGLQFQVKLED
jgi:transcriptional regulator with XRE-family HTH domain